MMEHLGLIAGAVGSVIAFLVTVFAVGWKKHVDTQLDKGLDASNAIKSNYVMQFTDVRRLISDMELANETRALADERRLNEAVTDLKNFILENCVSNEMCKERHRINSVFK